MAHKVKTQRWHRGQLVTEEFEFESLDDAQNFTTGISANFEVKIYDNEGQIVQKIGAVADVNSYA